MKTINVALDGHFAKNCTSLATLWKVTRRDAEVFGFTDHDEDIPFGGVLYKAKTGFSASEVQTSGKLNVDNLEVATHFDADSITEVDVVAGLWDKARIDVMRVNYRDLSMGAYEQRTGETGQFSYDGRRFTTELRGMMQYLANTIGSSYGANCPYRLGDEKCGVDLVGSPSLTQLFEVTAVGSRLQFTSDTTDADHWYRYGIVEWLTGDNAGFRMEVRDSADTGVIDLQLQMPYEIQIGDTGNLIPGCDKTEATCIAKFANVLNFGGFSDIPGMDRLVNSSVE